MVGGACVEERVAELGVEVMVTIMGVITVDGGENNLFNALAFFERYGRSDGQALRAHLENFLQTWPGSQPATTQEQDVVPSSQVYQRKGDRIISAYSLMKKIRVFVHTLLVPMGAVSVEEASYIELRNKEALPLVHIFHDSKTGQFAPLMEVEAAVAAATATMRSLNLPEVPATLPVEYSSLAAPLPARCRAYVACWTTPARYALTAAEEEELLRLAGWLLELLCMPPPSTKQIRARLRAWQPTLREHFGKRRLPWPWSFVIHGLIL